MSSFLAGQSGNTVEQTNKGCKSFSKGLGNVRKSSEIVGNLRKSRAFDPGMFGSYTFCRSGF